MKKRKAIYIVLILVILFAAMTIGSKPKVEGTNPWLKDTPLVMAHAGGKLYYPGNTMRAFRNSFEIGVDVLEMDVQVTSDDILVLRHGENETGNIRSMSNCDALIYEETYDYLFNNCNFGYNFQIGTGAYIYRDLTHEEWVEAEVYLTKLEELFMTFGKDILYNIEIKADGDAPRTKTADLLVELIEEYDLQDYVLVATNFEDISLYIIENYPNIMMSASHAKAQESILKSYSLTDKFLKPNGYYALQIPVSYEFPVIKEIDLANKFLVSRIQKHNMAVHYWTINDATTMRYLISIGANGIITDDPELLMDIITE